MSSEKTITARIIADAEKEAREKVDGARAKAESRVLEKKEMSQAKVDAIIAQADVKAEDILKKRESADALEQRKNILGCRRSKLDEAFKNAEEEIMKRDGYVDFMSRLLRECAEDGGVVHVAAKDTRLKQSGFVKNAGKDVKTGEDDPTISGGFRFVSRQGAMETDCSVASIIELCRQSLETDVCKILWGGVS